MVGVLAWNLWHDTGLGGKTTRDAVFELDDVSLEAVGAAGDAPGSAAACDVAAAPGAQGQGHPCRDHPSVRWCRLTSGC